MNIPTIWGYAFAYFPARPISWNNGRIIDPSRFLLVCGEYYGLFVGCLRLISSLLPILQWCHNGRDGVSNHQPHYCYPTVCSGADQRKHQSSASLVFVRGIHHWTANYPHKGPVTQKMCPFGDAIMCGDGYYHNWWRGFMFLKKGYFPPGYTINANAYKSSQLMSAIGSLIEPPLIYQYVLERCIPRNTHTPFVCFL